MGTDSAPDRSDGMSRSLTALRYHTRVMPIARSNRSSRVRLAQGFSFDKKPDPRRKITFEVTVSPR